MSEVDQELKTAADLRPGEKATVTDVDNDHPSAHRLLEIGFTPGEEIEYLTGGLFNDPMAFTIRGTIVAIRKIEARCILIQNRQ